MSAEARAREVARHLTALSQVYDNLAKIPAIKRGMVWCTACGHSQSVNGAHALQHGWPKHCGLTMTIDSPEERAALTALSAHEKDET